MIWRDSFYAKSQRDRIYRSSVCRLWCVADIHSVYAGGEAVMYSPKGVGGAWGAVETKCGFCHVPFSTWARRRIYCCHKCQQRMLYWREPLAEYGAYIPDQLSIGRPVTKRCRVCRTPFTTWINSRKYCSTECLHTAKRCRRYGQDCSGLGVRVPLDPSKINWAAVPKSVRREPARNPRQYQRIEGVRAFERECTRYLAEVYR